MPKLSASHVGYADSCLAARGDAKIAIKVERNVSSALHAVSVKVINATRRIVSSVKMKLKARLK